MPTAFEIQQQIDEEKRRVEELKRKIAEARTAKLALTDPLSPGVDAVQRAIGGEYAPTQPVEGSALAETAGLLGPKARQVVQRMEGALDPSRTGTAAGVASNIAKDARYLIPGWAGLEFGVRGGAEIGKAIGQQIFDPDKEKVLPSERGGAEPPKKKDLAAVTAEQVESLGHGLSMPITSAMDWATILGVNPASGGLNPMLELARGVPVEEVYAKYPGFEKAHQAIQDNPLLSSLLPAGVGAGVREVGRVKTPVEQHQKGYAPRTKESVDADKAYDAKVSADAQAAFMNMVGELQKNPALPPPPGMGEGFTSRPATTASRSRRLPNERTGFYTRESGEVREGYPEGWIMRDESHTVERPTGRQLSREGYSQAPFPPERYVGKGGVRATDFREPGTSKPETATTPTDVSSQPVRSVASKTIDDVVKEAVKPEEPQKLPTYGIDPENPFSGIVELQGGFGFTKEMFEKVVDVAGNITPEWAKRTATRFETDRGKDAHRMVDTAISRSKNVVGDLKEDARKAGVYSLYGKNAEAAGRALSDGTAPPKMKSVYDRAWNYANLALGGTLGKVTEYFPRVLKDKIAQILHDETMSIKQKNASLFAGGVDATKLEGLLQSMQRDGKISKYLAGAIQSNLKSGLAKTMAEAFVLAERDAQSHMIGRRGWEKTRTAQYPEEFYEWNARKVTDKYLESLGHRVAEAEMFGAKGEQYLKTYNVLRAIAPAEAELFKKMVSSFTGHWNLLNPPGRFRKAAELTNRITLVPKLGLSGASVPNWFQVAISGFTDFGIKSTAGAIWKALGDRKSQEANRRVGALEGSLRDIFDSSSRPGAIADAMMFPFNLPNKFQQHIHANIARSQIPELYKKANADVSTSWSSGQREIAREQLREYFSIDYRMELTEKKISESIVKYADNSQLIARVTSDPLMFHDPNVRWAFFLKRFGPKRFMQFKDQLTSEWRNGNAPAMNKLWHQLKKTGRLGVGAVGAGEATIFLTDELKSAVTGQEQTRADESWDERIINDLAAAALAGTVTDFIGADDKEWYLDMATTPVALNVWGRFVDTSFKMFDEMKKYETDDVLRRSVKPLTAIAGGVIGQIGQAAQTTDQRKQSVEKRFGDTKSKIFDAFERGDADRAARLRVAWDIEYPERPMLNSDLSWKEYNEWMKRKAKKRANP